jgi:hypothetical protein
VCVKLGGRETIATRRFVLIIVIIKEFAIPRPMSAIAIPASWGTTVL